MSALGKRRSVARRRLDRLTAKLTRWAYEPFPPLGADGRDPFRWCVYCGCDCCGCDCCDPDPEHRADCASVTGLRPVTARELGMRGLNDPYAYGMRCMDCGEEFRVGDVTALRGGFADDVFETVCVGCRVLNPESTARAPGPDGAAE